MMNGFEYQAAAHMIAEGMVKEGVAVIKTLDERYDGNKRNPFNEVDVCAALIPKSDSF